VSGETALELFNEEIGIGEMGDVSEQLNSEEGNAVIRKNGYDGIINSIGGDHLEYIAFKPQTNSNLVTSGHHRGLLPGKNAVLVWSKNSLRHTRNKTSNKTWIKNRRGWALKSATPLVVLDLCAPPHDDTR